MSPQKLSRSLALSVPWPLIGPRRPLCVFRFCLSAAFRQLAGVVTAMAVALPIEEVAERYGAYALDAGRSIKTKLMD